MYQSFYGFSDDPFKLSPTTSACFEHRTFAKARSYVVYTLSRKEGILVITGVPGSGKTTLVSACIADTTAEDITFVEVSPGKLSPDDFLYLVAHRFGLDCDGLSAGRIRTSLETRLINLHNSGVRGVLLIDEAQELDIASMHVIKMLSNLEYQGELILQIVLVGQTALLQYLREPELESLFQRVTAACQLELMTEDELQEYVRHRLSCCGWNGDPAIDQSVIKVLFQHTRGNPRRTNLICSRLLLRGMLKNVHELVVLDVKMVLDELYKEGLVIDETHIRGETSKLKDAYQ